MSDAVPAQLARAPSTLLVASTGGHLQELITLRDRLVPPCGLIEWVTHDSTQVRSLLAGEQVHYVRNVRQREYLAAATNLPVALRLLSKEKFDRIVTTGAGIALPLLAAGRMRNVACHYVESAARAGGPSLTGRLISLVPGVHTYTQSRSWEDDSWLFRGSVFDGFTASNKESPLLRRIVVTLGTLTGYPFTRALTRLSQILPMMVASGGDILWQADTSAVGHLPGRVCKIMPAVELRAAIRESDLVIAHAGVGSALMALENGRCPVLLPRRQLHGEHVDDHQSQIAAELEGRGLAVTAEADRVSGQDLVRAASVQIFRTAATTEFLLADT